jgi:hypothetical protein
MNTDPKRIPAGFLGKWLLFTSLGWIIGFIVSFIAAYAVNIVYPK